MKLLQLKGYCCPRLPLSPSRVVNISVVLSGRDLKEVDEEIWVACFVLLDLGYIELEQTTRGKV